MFEWLGEALGSIIAAIGRLAAAIWNGVSGALDGFFDGLSRGVGLQNADWLAWLLLAFGLYLIYAGLRDLFQRIILGGLIKFLIGCALMTYVVS